MKYHHDVKELHGIGAAPDFVAPDPVAPAKAGAQVWRLRLPLLLDPGFRRDDESPVAPHPVAPANAGVQHWRFHRPLLLDPGFRRDDAPRRTGERRCPALVLALSVTAGSRLSPG